MRVGLYTIPATGTRFVSQILRDMGADYSRRHVGDPPPVPEWRRVLTVRHPYDTYLSHMHMGHSKTDAEFVSKWAHYIWKTQWMDAFYFPLDVKPENREVLIQDLMHFCDVPRTMDFIRSVEWSSKNYESDRDRSAQVPPSVRELLKFAVEWYEHYTVFFGARYRHPECMIGEKA